MTVVRFFLSCVPPKTSHAHKKIVTFKLKDGRQFTKLGDRPELVEAKASLDELLIPHQIAAPVPPPVLLAVEFTWPWLAPSTHSRKFRAPGRQRHTSKPDLSNVVKTLEDRLVKLRFLEDDRSVAEVWMRKWWGDHPGIAIAIAPFTERPAVVPEQQDIFAALEVSP